MLSDSLEWYVGANSLLELKDVLLFVHGGSGFVEYSTCMGVNTVGNNDTGPTPQQMVLL